MAFCLGMAFSLLSLWLGLCQEELLDQMPARANSNLEKHRLDGETAILGQSGVELLHHSADTDQLFCIHGGMMGRCKRFLVFIESSGALTTQT